MSCLIARFGCRALSRGWWRAGTGLDPIAHSETCTLEEAEVELVGSIACIDQTVYLIVVSIVLTNEMVITKTMCLCLVHELDFFCVLAVTCLAAFPLSPSID